LPQLRDSSACCAHESNLVYERFGTPTVEHTTPSRRLTATPSEGRFPLWLLSCWGACSRRMLVVNSSSSYSCLPNTQCSVSPPPPRTHPFPPNACSFLCLTHSTQHASCTVKGKRPPKPGDLASLATSATLMQSGIGSAFILQFLV
jgi:hypothetical protein